MEDNLPELRDIHLPDTAVSFWPPAYGWWVILGTIIATFLVVWLWGYCRRKSKKRYALAVLQSLDVRQADSLSKVSELLRRICVFKYPQAAVLTGSEWIAFLNNHSQNHLEGKAADILINAPYINPRSLVYGRDEVMKMYDFCYKWIGENL